MTVLNCFHGCIYYFCPPPRACRFSLYQHDCSFELIEEFFSTQALCFHQAASVILLWAQRAALIRSRSLACVLCHRPNAYYDLSNGPLFTPE